MIGKALLAAGLGLGLALTLPVAAGADALEDCATMLRFTGPPESGDDRQRYDHLCRRGYVLAHDPTHRVPAWVLEVLDAERFVDRADRARSHFQPDPDLPAERRAELGDYRGSGFDRGHMAPAADMKWDQGAMDESFYLSNMAPQVGRGFNRGVWRELETYARDLVPGRDVIVVITGPIYEQEPAPTKPGGDVDVPSHFFKIVYQPARKRAIAFKLPNAKLPGGSLASYIVSIRSLEDETGLDFFTALKRRDQNRIERLPAYPWRVFQH